MPSETPHVPVLRSIMLWCREYGNGGNSDQDALKVFAHCETHEAVRALQAELMAIANDKIPEKTLDGFVGKARSVRHGGYPAWAKVMLLWLSGASKEA